MPSFYYGDSDDGAPIMISLDLPTAFRQPPHLVAIQVPVHTGVDLLHEGTVAHRRTDRWRSIPRDHVQPPMACGSSARRCRSKECMAPD